MTLLHAPRPHLPHRLQVPHSSRLDAPHHASTAAMLRDQLVHDLRDLWRARVVFVFTFLFPLTWLVVLGTLMGNDTVDEDTGVRLMQFLTPIAAAMGVLYATFPTVATTLSIAREHGDLKRVRGTPMPPWVYLAGRLGAAVVFAAGSVATMLLVGWLAYDVDLVGRTAPAAAVNILAAIVCFATIGLATAALAPSSSVAQSGSIAASVALAFVSGLMTVGDLPGWADRVASVFPLKHFNDALLDQFNPYLDGGQWDLRALAVMAAWTVGAGVLAVHAFRWDPAVRHTTRQSTPASLTAETSGRTPVALHASKPGRPSPLRELLDQARWATRATRRDFGSVFFAVVMPLSLFAFMMSVYDPESTGPAGEEIGVYTLAGMAAWGTSVLAFVNLPSAVAEARDAGIVKRLRGTPLRMGAYLAGRTVSALAIALVTFALLLGIGELLFDLKASWVGVPLAGGVVVLGTVSLAACGFLLASAVRSAKAVSAVGLAVLLPASFLSGVFVAGDIPGWMDAVAAVFPLKHLTHSLVLALEPGGEAVSWTGVAVMSAWALGAALLAARTFGRERAA